MKEPILIFTNSLTSRLDFICKFIFKDVLQVPFVFTTSIAKVQNHALSFINYSDVQLPNGLQIIPHTILFETEIKPQNLEQNEWQHTPTFFTTNGTFIPFDIFGASFYLVTRYEEYLEKNRDEYERFPHIASIAHLWQFLDKPLVDIWCHGMYKMLCETNDTLCKSPKLFSRLHTFDIDMIRAYQHKGFVKNVGGFIKNIIYKDWIGVEYRWQVLIGKQLDLFDSFPIINQKLSVKSTSIFFFLMAENSNKFDKNLAPNHPVMTQLIKSLASNFNIGIHPSYQSNESPELVLKELQNLQLISKQSITDSRQHYIKFSMPDTFQQLVKVGIKKDYSMGYGSINGFRASTCTAHYWFDVSTNKISGLQIVPFCWMDANCMYEQKMTADEALENWEYYYKICQQYNGLFVDIWHNFIIGNGDFNKDWFNAWQKTIDVNDMIT